jgi:hypothetical protein
MEPRVAIALLRNHHVRGALTVTVLIAALLPVLATAAVTGLIAQHQEETCGTVEPLETPAGGGAIAHGEYAAPLQLKPGKRYQVGATEYGGPGDPTSGDYGAIPDPQQSYLPAHPDSYAELSLLQRNPANGGSFTFADADALNHLPYLTGLRVSRDGHSELLYKRDVGYGQGPGQSIENGEPYRLDLWWQAAQALGVSKSAVQIQLAPASGSAATLGALPATLEGEPGNTTAGAGGCAATGEGGTRMPLPLSAGVATRILASGLAAAGAQAPPAVQAMVAAGNRLHSAGYLYGGAHGTSLDTLQGAYDCSSAVSYLLHAGGKLGASSLDSSSLEGYGQPGPGRYVTIYANAAHTFMYVAGLRFDTVEAPAYDTGPNSGKPGPRWRVSPSVPDWASWVIRHPQGL